MDKIFFTTEDFQAPEYQNAIKENARRQTDIIHIVTAYHADRIRKGYPAALTNLTRDDESDRIRGEAGGSPTPNPHVLKKSIEVHGPQTLDIIGHVRNNAYGDPVSVLMQGVFTSIWDSVNHVLNIHRKTADAAHEDFLENPELHSLIEKSYDEGKNLMQYRGAGTVHSGFTEGFPVIKILLDIEYGLRGKYEFDSAKIAGFLAKTDEMGLVAVQFDNLFASMGMGGEMLKKYFNAESKIGIPKETTKKHCKPAAMGCPARFPIGPAAAAILKTHALYEERYTGHENESALSMIVKDIRTFVFDQLDRVFAELSFEEKEKCLSKNSLMSAALAEAGE